MTRAERGSVTIHAVWVAMVLCIVAVVMAQMATMVRLKHQVASAAADLLHQYGYELPSRPASWYAKQQRQKPIRSAIEGAKVRHVQRRIFRIFLPLIEEIDDQEERREETEYLWDAAEEIAVLTVAGRSS